MGLASMILLAGSIVLMFFVVLSGVTNSTPLNKTWFLRADYSYEGSGRTTSQWTYFYVCGNHNQNCGAPVPALPLGYAWLGHNAEVPDALTGYIVSSHRLLSIRILMLQQLARQGYHKHILLLHVALWMGLLSYGPHLQRPWILSRAPRPMQPSRICHLWHNYWIRSLLVHSRDYADDVGHFFFTTQLNIAVTKYLVPPS